MTINRLLVSKKELRELGIPYSFAHIARLEAAGLFPKRVKLGACRVAWRYEKIVGWVQDREAGRLRDYITDVS
jgi:prophage regulatory protein